MSYVEHAPPIARSLTTNRAEEDLMRATTGLFATYTRRESEYARERKDRLLKQLRDDLEALQPVRLILFDHPDLSSRRIVFRNVRLFPLGEFRYVWLELISGRTILYYGDDGRLYEYGPSILSSGELTKPTQNNSISLRPLNIDKLEYGDLMLLQELVQRPSVI